MVPRRTVWYLGVLRVPSEACAARRQLRVPLRSTRAAAHCAALPCWAVPQQYAPVACRGKRLSATTRCRASPSRRAWMRSAEPSGPPRPIVVLFSHCRAALRLLWCALRRVCALAGRCASMQHHPRMVHPAPSLRRSQPQLLRCTSGLPHSRRRVVRGSSWPSEGSPKEQACCAMSPHCRA
jgi:hypothetical protein